MTLADFKLTDNDYLKSIWVALKRIEEALVLLVPSEPLALPAPIVRVDAPDLTDIVTAVQGLGGSQGPSASDIAEAIANVLRPPDSPPGSEEALAEVASAIKDLNFRLQGLGKQAYGGGSVSLTPADIAAISGLTNDQLRAAAVPVSGTFWQTTQPVKDDYQSGEVLADQSGAGAVLTFTFSTTMSMVTCLSIGTSLTARADPFGGTPTSTLGIRLDDGVPVFIPVNSSSVKVFAPAGTSISVWGLKRT
jgi:hypothetical protein